MKIENIKRLKVNNTVYEFVNGWSRTNYSTSEKTTLFIDDIETSNGVYRWINRPWQSYDYESSMNDCIYNLIANRKNAIKEDYKRQHGFKKITAKRYEELETIYSNDSKLKELKTVSDIIHDGYYNGFYHQTKIEF